MTIRGGGDTRWAMATMPPEECARHPGASPPKRMAASWSGSDAGPTEYKVAARGSRLLAGSPRFICCPYSSPKHCAAAAKGRPRPWRRARTPRDAPTVFRYVTVNRHAKRSPTGGRARPQRRRTTGPLSRSPPGRATAAPGPLPPAGGPPCQTPALAQRRR